MKSIANLAHQPAGTPIVADDVLEFHAARLLMLFRLCGIANRIDGLTKMAKLDFFVRYPQFFDILHQSEEGHISPSPTIESSMVRFHYGPWDRRYYHVLGYLKAKGLIEVLQKGPTFQLQLTELGKEIANQLTKDPAFAGLAERMKKVKRVLGNKTGSALKKMVYRLFDQEVAQRSLGEVIH